VHLDESERCKTSPMLRRKTHKFSIQTTGLTEEQAAQVMFLVCSLADSYGVAYESTCNVPLRVLRDCYPDSAWHRASGLSRVGTAR
jgi:hypothetical protein